MFNSWSQNIFFINSSQTQLLRGKLWFTRIHSELVWKEQKLQVVICIMNSRKGREEKRREEVRVACKLCGRTADRTWWQSYRATNNRRRVRTNSSTEYGDTTGFFGSEGADFRNRDKDRGSQMLSVDNNILTWLTNRSLIYWHRGIF